MNNLIIPDSAYPYLRVQKGEINHIEDRTSFEMAYNQGLQELLYQILPHIPTDIKSSLDIGSGMGGIDILLQQEFGHDVYLLDAGKTPPVCIKHDIPFNDYEVVIKFFNANNSKIAGYNDPEFMGEFPIIKMDLILSVGSYCFHYSPLIYLDFVKASCHKDTILIFDVRKRHIDWLEILCENFTEVAVILESEKFTKRVFKTKC
jgi:hypothetical protein